MLTIGQTVHFYCSPEKGVEDGPWCALVCDIKQGGKAANLALFYPDGTYEAREDVQVREPGEMPTGDVWCETMPNRRGRRMSVGRRRPQEEDEDDGMGSEAPPRPEAPDLIGDPDDRE